MEIELRDINEKLPLVETVEIRADSSMTVELNKKWFKVNYGETRIIRQPDKVNIEEERNKLWNTVNGEVDKQIADIIQSFKD